MEVYIPYIIGSSFSAFLGKVAYSYIYLEESSDSNNSNDSNDSQFNLIDSNLFERTVNSDKYILPLGTTTKEKTDTLNNILIVKCNRHIPINNTKKIRHKWLRLINEYNFIGHEEFIYKYKKKNKKN